MNTTKPPMRFTSATLRGLRKRWPTMTVKGGLTSVWRKPYAQRGDLMVPRSLVVTFSSTTGESVELSLSSDETGQTKITKAVLSNPAGIRFSTDSDDSSQLAVVALLHASYVKATEQLARDIPQRPIRWGADGSPFIGLTDSQGRFGSPELMRTALRSLDAVTSRRRVLTEDHLRDVAAVYQDAVAAGSRKPTKAVADKFSRPHPTAVTWVSAARKAGFIPPVERNS